MSTGKTHWTKRASRRVDTPALFVIRGFVVVVPHVRNVYPVEKTDTGWEWGFKFADGFYEQFAYLKEQDAAEDRAALLKALSDYFGRKP